MVLMARAGADRGDLTWSPHLDDDHRADDVVPVLLPLTVWNQTIRAYYGHARPAAPTVTGTTHYLADRLTDLAQDTTGGFDWQRFTTDMAAVPRQLERVLHDEQDPEQGVACFECGDRRLVRKFARPARAGTRPQNGSGCGEGTGWPAAATRSWSRTRLSGGWHSARVAAATRAASRIQRRAVVGVRRLPEDLHARRVRQRGALGSADRGPDGDGWTHLTMAAEAATTMTGRLIPASTVRKWMDRGRVASCCRWTSGTDWGLRLVFWPDVADAATASERRRARAS
ncbi:hypothetical protein [Nocardioides sp. SYSU DS0663]|uniref:hypothetical protein n=1 Tax=Nocardioides sp. SYSU DS0663 TaxID=3416445 RepID=UPI003F4C359C